MAKNGSSSARTSGRILRDGDWVTILAALLKDSHADSRDLARRLLARSKHGRQVRLLRFMNQRTRTLNEMARLLKVSRRTVFRYLNDLQEYGVRLQLDDGQGYRLGNIPTQVRRLF